MAAQAAWRGEEQRLADSSLDCPSGEWAATSASHPAGRLCSRCTMCGHTEAGRPGRQSEGSLCTECEHAATLEWAEWAEAANPEAAGHCHKRARAGSPSVMRSGTHCTPHAADLSFVSHTCTLGNERGASPAGSALNSGRPTDADCAHVSIHHVGADLLPAPRKPMMHPLFEACKAASEARSGVAAKITPPVRNAEPGAWALITGDDAELSAAEHEEWRQAVKAAAAGGGVWFDPDFPPTQRSVSGADESKPTSATLDDAPLPASSTASEAPDVGTNIHPQEVGGLVRGGVGTEKAVAPRCPCDVQCMVATVVSNTPNKGRHYYRCARRSCGFFVWADSGDAGGNAGALGSKTSAPLSWVRMPAELPLVTDYGFRAEDLRQGGVGDCWFMSALAVVAERHDLVLKIFSAHTEREPTGCHCLRLFLDGRWRSVLVDDYLPVSPSPRRAHLSLDTRLAFCRCASPMGGQQLWASMVEKAYAKAHGSYQAISGGMVAEALLDLTGAPTEIIDFSESSFDPEVFWARLRAYSRLGLPMGCGTNSAVGEDQLREVGLCGGHAYSLLDVREVRCRRGGTVRLLRIRNPHGVGEWNGDWSDSSRKWSEIIEEDAEGAAAGLERTGVDDGTFWQEYVHFLQSFAHLDVCFALRGWHARSLQNSFPADKRGTHRLCSAIHLIIRGQGTFAGRCPSHVFSGDEEVGCDTASPVPGSITDAREKHQSSATLFVAALQPTRRGVWCRSDRKKSYRLGDLSVFIVQLEPRTFRLLRVVGGGLRGADRGERVVAATLNDPDGLYAIFTYCFGSGPSAAETVASPPFTVRVLCSEPFHAVTIPSGASASNANIAKVKRANGGGLRPLVDGLPRMSALIALASLHAIALEDPVLGQSKHCSCCKLGARDDASHAVVANMGSDNDAPHSHSKSHTESPSSSSVDAPHAQDFRQKPWRSLHWKEIEKMLLRPENAALLPDGADGGGAPARKEVALGRACNALVVSGSGLTLIFGSNSGVAPAHIRVRAFAKSSMARSLEGPVANDKASADEYFQTRLAAAEAALGPGHAAMAAAIGNSSGFKWPARWQSFEGRILVSPGRRRLVLAVVASGVQAEMGEIQCTLVDRSSVAVTNDGGTPGHSNKGAKTKGVARLKAVAPQQSAAAMRRWLGGDARGDAELVGQTGGSGKAQSMGGSDSDKIARVSANLPPHIDLTGGVFSELPLDFSRVFARSTAGGGNTFEMGGASFNGKDMLLVQGLAATENNLLQQGRDRDKHGHGGTVGFHSEFESRRPLPAMDAEETALQAALAASLLESEHSPRVSEKAVVRPSSAARTSASEQEEADLAAAIARSLRDEDIPGQGTSRMGPNGKGFGGEKFVCAFSGRGPRGEAAKKAMQTTPIGEGGDQTSVMVIDLLDGHD